MLKALKRTGTLAVNEKQFETFMTDVGKAAATVVRRVNPDIIIYPKSKSPLLKQFVDEIAKYTHAEILGDRFIKAVLDAEDVEPLLNTKHPDWKKFSSEYPEDVQKLKKQLITHVKRGELELKKLYKPYVKFIQNFVELRDAYEVLDKVMGQKVLVIDDILSTGSTMAEMIRQLTDLEPFKIAGLTLLKHTISPK